MATIMRASILRAGAGIVQDLTPITMRGKVVGAYALPNVGLTPAGLAQLKPRKVESIHLYTLRCQGDLGSR